MTKSVSHFLQRRRPARNCLTANMDDPVQLRPRNSRRYVIYFARQQSNNLSIGQIISFFDRQSPLSKTSCLDLPIYRAVPRTAHHSSQSASLPTWTIPSTQATKPPADTSAQRSVTHQENLAPGRSYTAEPRDRQATPRTYAVVFLRPAIVTQASHILCFGAFTNAPKQRVCWYMMCAAHSCTVIWIRSSRYFCHFYRTEYKTPCCWSSPNLFGIRFYLLRYYNSLCACLYIYSCFSNMHVPSL
jgi:hypothetical protein